MTEPMDMTVLAQDEALFEALGRGDPPPAGDDVAMLLAAWRADLTDTDTTVRPAIPPVVGISRPRRYSSTSPIRVATLGLTTVNGNLRRSCSRNC